MIDNGISLATLIHKIAAEEKGSVSKKYFGWYMHNDDISEVKKQTMLKQVELLGGYDCLED